MAQHIVTGIVPPASAPTDLGMHYIDTVAKKAYLSVGTSSSADWLPLSSPGHKVLDATAHGDAATATIARGDVLVGDSTPKIGRLAVGASGKFLRSDGTDPGWQNIAASDIASGTMATARLGSGTANSSSFLRGDQTWASPTAAGVVPIGAVVAWLKSLTGTPALPAEYVECNGQTISDGASPFNGQTIPNLNGTNQFLRGNSTSGGTGGAATHDHSFSGTTDVEDGDTDVQSNTGAPALVAALGHVHSYTGTSDAASSLPPCTDVVWIMRIK